MWAVMNPFPDRRKADASVGKILRKVNIRDFLTLSEGQRTGGVTTRQVVKPSDTTMIVILGSK